MTEKPTNQNNQIPGARAGANQPHIFLDLDGVLADFDLHAHQENKYTADGKVKYDALDYKWWATMPPCDGAKEFYDEVRKLGVAKFLTGPIAHEDCFSGKARWVQNFVPERGKQILKDLIICASGDKVYLAAAGRILIDDRIANVKAWEAAGGTGILHSGDFKATLQKLQEVVAKIAVPAVKPEIKVFRPEV